MKRIKLFTALLLAAAMVLPMAGCGKGKPKDGGEASPASCAAAGVRGILHDHGGDHPHTQPA